MSDEFQRCFPEWTLARVDSLAASRGVEADVDLWQDSVGLLTLSQIGEPQTNKYRLRFADQIAVDLLIDEKALIETAKAAVVPASTRDHFLADQVLPRMLAHEGRLVLHAGAVRVDDRAVAILGKSGSGKSTLVASFDQAEHVLLGDDALVVSLPDGVPCTRSVYRSLRLFPDSIAQLFPAVATSAVAHYTPKQRVRLTIADRDDTAPVPLCALFVITDSVPDAAIHVRPLSIADACMAIVENSFALDPTDPQRARQRLEAASDLARQVPAFAISYPRDYARLPDVRSAILTHLASCALEAEG